MIQKLRLTLFSLGILLCLPLHPESQTKLFSGSIEFPCNMEYDLCLFYKGQKLDFESNSTSPFVQFSFLDSKDTHTVFLIITNSLTCSTSESNNVDCLRVIDESSYICYKLQAKRELDEDEHQLLSWDISQHNLENGQLPHNSLIFLFEPSLIAGLKVQSWKPENVFRIVPTLVIYSNSSIEQIQRAMIVARLAALDVDAIHAKSTLANPTNAILTAMQ